MVTSSQATLSDGSKPQLQTIPKDKKNQGSPSSSGASSPDLSQSAINDNVSIFRHAVGINSQPPSYSGTKLEEGRRLATGIYKAVLREKNIRRRQYWAINLLVYFCHFAQIIISASVTALGPSSKNYSTVLTVLGAINTVIAGILALLNGRGLPDRLRRDETEFRKTQDWIEETESLIAAGIIGFDREQIGHLIEAAFKKYNAAKATSENNKMSSYVKQQTERRRNAAGAEDDPLEDATNPDGNTLVKLNVPGLH
ncbi:conserved hypothetical protein [Paecilomyces variotii No. 5]|uniref:SMODS and SLOG-associating 2TM effector domain-containing protein n=1 Tax=Byssochlamys spectabilis (strain No. 5 / NBRC 109023) TaxID=1356009 RepID=V5GBU5_BYSSN|nr:conserved hypothetical protein [Paecilomyces variotii No. 5]